jgi:Flp pilus assembly pilin Flp
MKMKLRRKSGQAMVEYIIIVAVVAIAALVIFGIFGDTIQEKLAGATSELDSDSQAASSVQDSKAFLQDLDADGSGN